MNKYFALIEFTKYLKIIIMAVIIIGSVLVTYFVTFSNYKIFNDYQKEIVIQQSKNEVLDKRIAQLDKIKRISATIETTNTVAKQAVPEEIEIPIVMAVVQILSRDSGVALSSLRYSGNFATSYSASSNTTATVVDPMAEVTLPEDEITAISESTPSAKSSAAAKEDALRVQGSVSGKLPDLIKFLTEVEHSRRIFNIESVNYSTVLSTEAQTSTGVLDLKFTLASYFKNFSDLSNATNVSDIDFDKFKDLISKLNSYKYVEIDLSKIDVGKNDPFSNSNTNNNSEINSVEPSSGLNNNTSQDAGINVVEIEGTGSTSTSAESATQDQEASPTTNITGTLLDILKQEGVSQ